MQQKNSFAVSVSELEGFDLAGLCVRTSMQNAFADCSQLWERAFMPRMPEFSGKPANEFQGATFGVCVMAGEEEVFDYWAAAPLVKGAPMPEGMRGLRLQGGLYAHCRVPSLEVLDQAYMALYADWPSRQTEYSPLMQAPCFERYGEEYLKNGSLEVYMPVTRI